MNKIAAVLVAIAGPLAVIALFGGLAYRFKMQTLHHVQIIGPHAIHTYSKHSVGATIVMAGGMAVICVALTVVLLLLAADVWADE